MSRIAIVTPEPIGERMAGPAIRAWNMAEVLARTHEVRLLSTAIATITCPSFVVRNVDERSMAEERDWADVLVAHPGVLRTHSAIQDADAVLVVDLYDPFHLENLGPDGGTPEERMANVRHLTSVLNDAMRRGDYFLCATERQRDFWFGSLASLGRMNPATYEADTTFEALIGVVPFGIPMSPPLKKREVLRGVVPGIGADDRVLLWGGGVYNWFDPLTLIEAVDIARHQVPEVRLVFLGMTHPNPDLPPMRVAAEARVRADELGLTDRHVFFNHGWVPYDERADYLLEADIGVSTHQLHIETRFSFRTRLLDYLWAGLPIITSEGDAFADLTRSEDIGEAVPTAQPGPLAHAIVALLQDDDRRITCAANARRVAERFRWAEVLKPLVAFCDAPTRAADQPSPHARARSVPDTVDAMPHLVLEDVSRELADLHLEQRYAEPLANPISAGQYRWLTEAFSRSVASGARVLEWGCGHGSFSYWLLRNGYEVDALDFEAPALLSTLLDLGGERYRFVEASDSVSLPFENATFDAVASIGLLPHDWEFDGTEEQSLQEISRVLKPSGVFVCAELPNASSWRGFAVRHLLPHRRNLHHQPYRRSELAALIEPHGFELRELVRYGVIPRTAAASLVRRAREPAKAVELVYRTDRALSVPFGVVAQNLGFVAIRDSSPPGNRRGSQS